MYNRIYNSGNIHDKVNALESNGLYVRLTTEQPK